MVDDSFLENCQGWTPTPDVLVRKKGYGFEAAYLWGRLRRLCQMGKGTYTISHEAIGNRIGMSRRTVIKYLDKLIEDGYVDDLTPDVRNKPHTYSVKRGEDKILAELQAGMQISHTETTTPEETEVLPAQDNDIGMRNLHTSDKNGSAEIAQQDSIGMQELPSGMQNLHSGYAENAQDGMQNLHLKDSKEIQLKDTKRERESRTHKETNFQKLKRIGDVDYLSQNEAFATKLTEICGNPHPKFVVNGKRRELAEATARLLDWGATIEQLQQFRDSWKFDDPPWTNQVVNQWGRFLGGKQSGKDLKNGNDQRNSGPLSGTGESLEGKPTYNKYTKELIYPDGRRVPAVS